MVFVYLFIAQHTTGCIIKKNYSRHKPKFTFCPENSMKTGDNETEMYEGWGRQ